MKKSRKILLPILGLSSLGISMAPILSLSSCHEDKDEVIPADYFVIEEGIVKGFTSAVKKSGLGSHTILDFNVLEEEYNGTLEIEESAFWNCRQDRGFNIKQIIFTNSIKKIGQSAFAGCANVEMLDFSSFTNSDFVPNLFGNMCFERWNNDAAGTILFSDSIDQYSKDAIVTDLYATAKLKYNWYSIDFIKTQTTGLCAEIMGSDEWTRMSGAYRQISVETATDAVKLYLNEVASESVKIILSEDLIEQHIKSKNLVPADYPYTKLYVKVESDTISVERDDQNVPWGISGKVITQTYVKGKPDNPYNIIVEYSKMPLVATPIQADHSRICLAFDKVNHANDWSIKLTCEQLINPSGSDHTVLLAHEADQSKGIKSISEFQKEIKALYPEDVDFMGFYLIENIYYNVSIKSGYLRDVSVSEWRQ